jgi:cytochrome c peroxidase
MLARGTLARWLLALCTLAVCVPALARPPFPPSAWPADDPALVQLGRLLFHDRALSVNGTVACSDCHRQALAFTDGLPQARGATGEVHPRNTPGLANVAWMASLGWSDPLLWQLEVQHRIPLFGRAPLEMGLAVPLPAALRDRLAGHPRYVAAFAAAPAGARPDADGIVQALAAFARSLVSFRSPFDAWLYRDARDALSADAVAGFALFNGERLGCGGCHGGFLVGGAVRTRAMQQAPLLARNGVPWSAADPGLALHTGRAEDAGLFRVPSLRNVALTAPYMHDGSIATLDGVLTHYERAAAAAAAASADAVGDVAAEPRLRGFVLDATERRQLLAFLHALTDTAFVQDAAFADPW